MSDDIVNQLKDLASTLKRGEGRSTVYGAVTEIERLRTELLEAQKDLGLIRRSRDRRDYEIERLKKSISELSRLGSIGAIIPYKDMCDE